MLYNDSFPLIEALVNLAFIWIINNQSLHENIFSSNISKTYKLVSMLLGVIFLIGWRWKDFYDFKCPWESKLILLEMTDVLNIGKTQTAFFSAFQHFI